MPDTPKTPALLSDRELLDTLRHYKEGGYDDSEILDLIKQQQQAYGEWLIGDSDAAMTMSPPIGIGIPGREWTDSHEAMRKAQYRDQLRAELRAINNKGGE